MTPDTRDNILHAARQLADAADRCAEALDHHRENVPPGFAWEAHDLKHWAAEVNAWAEAVAVEEEEAMGSNVAAYVRSQGGAPCPRCGAFASESQLCASCTRDDEEEATA